MSRTNTSENDGLLKPDEQFVGRIDTPFSVQLIPRRNAVDHASMRARQLNGLLLLMTGDGFDVFEGLSEGPKQEMLWLAQQWAAELADMVEVVQRDTKG